MAKQPTPVSPRSLEISTDELLKGSTFTVNIDVRRGWRTRVAFALIRLAARILRSSYQTETSGGFTVLTTTGPRRA